MLEGRFRAIDSDMHVMEPPDLYLKFMDPKWGNRIPRGSPRKSYEIIDFETSDGKSVRAPIYAGGVQLSGKTPVAKRHARVAPFFDEAVARDFDPTSQLRAMDVEGIDVAVLFRTFPLSQSDERLEPEYAMAICAAWNDWIADFCRADPKRLKASALLTLHDVDLAVAETRRAVKELGAVGLCIITDPIKGRHVHIRYFDPLWAEAERLGVPICVHPTGGPTMDRFRDHPHHTVIGRALCNPLELAMAVACFCAGGVLERFPRLRVAFLEGNCSWLPWLLYRLDEVWEKFGAWEEIPLERRPSDYFLRQCFISVDVDEDLVGDVVRRIGDDTIVFSTDYPHHDCEFPNATKLLMASLAKAGVGEAATRKILWANAGRLYNLG